MRSYSMKPVTFPMILFLIDWGQNRLHVPILVCPAELLLGRDCFYFCSGLCTPGEGCSLFRCMDLAQGTLVFVGEDLDELGAGRVPVVQQIAGALAAGPAVVLFQ